MPVRDNDSVAVVIGISNYTFLGTVPACHSDARSVAETLRRIRGMNPKNIAVMTDDAARDLMPTREIVRERVRMCADEARPDGMAFVYFAGHAVKKGNELLLVPVDCRPENGIPASEIVAALDTSRARDRVLVIDACHADAELKGVGGLGPPLVSRKPQVAVFISCDEGEYSYPAKDGSESAYTRAFVGALEALSAGRTSVTAQALQERIDDMMRQWRLESGKKQTPKLILPAERDVTIVPGGK